MRIRTVRLSLSSILLTVFGFLLLLEWVWPIEKLSGSAVIWVFVLFLVISFFLVLLQVPLLISAVIKGFAVLYFLYDLYYSAADLFSMGWIATMLVDIKSSIGSLLSWDIQGLSHLFRSLLFFIFLWLMVYLLQYWLIQRKKIFLFFLLTLFYITVFDTFTPYEANIAIVRTVLIGLGMTSILFFQDLVTKENLKIGKSVSRKWMLTLSIMLFCSTVLGYVLPKADSIWPDPFSYVGVMSQNANNQLGNLKQVGYGVDDTSLGGPMMGDTAVVFKSEVESPHYWKIETKDIYTGKGWISSDVNAERLEFYQDGEVPISSYDTNPIVQKDVQTSKVKQIKMYDHVMYPFGVTKIQTDDGFSFEMDPMIEKLYSIENDEPAPLPEYTVTFEKPSYNLTALQATKSRESSRLSDEFMAKYTQLPGELPQRVRELAQELTVDGENWFDKARAIEQYLKGPEFSYDLLNAVVPGENDDYVDQFLFESKVGYCNNFSTSMVVLLRSLYIPSRWVKGFTPGVYIGYENNAYQYEVTNNNAHSWVEVYFPHVGWVTFEPTPGFVNSLNYYVDEEEAEKITSVQQEQLDQKEEVEETEQVNNKEEDSSVWTKIQNGAKFIFAHHLSWLVIAFIMLVAVGYYIYRIRVKWLPSFYIRKFKRTDHSESFADAYMILLKQLERYGLKRKAGQTLREYAQEVDDYFSTKEMVLLTLQYERYLYGNQLEEDTWKRMVELWENLIKKTAS